MALDDELLHNAPPERGLPKNPPHPRPPVDTTPARMARKDRLKRNIAKRATQQTLRQNEGTQGKAQLRRAELEAKRFRRGRK